MQSWLTKDLFERDASGEHFCTASVVASPGKDLLITAAHCINGGKGSGYKKDIVFIPAYRDGDAPFGVWTPQRLLVGPQWGASPDRAGLVAHGRVDELCPVQ